MYHPLVSIITPSYNRAWIIQSCLDCVHQQIYPYIEHIVVDGGSTDQTTEILKKNQDAYGLKWISERDKGMYDAINKGMRMASGEIVAYLNTDDFYFPYTVELVVNAFRQDPALDLVYGDWVTYYVESNFVEVLPFLTYSKYDMARFGVLPQPTVFFKRAILNQIGDFDISYKLLADNEFFTRAYMADLHIKKVNEFLAGQTVHKGNLLAGNKDAVLIALQESDRFHNFYWEQLTSSTNGLAYLSQLYAILRSKTYYAIWRLRLLEFFIRYKLNRKAKWQHFLKLLPPQSIDGFKLFVYLLSRNRESITYCKIENFLDFIP